MSLLFQFVLLCVGLYFLWKGGALSVQNAVGFSLIYKIETFTIGFFIFAISTGLPEISSAVISSIKNVPELSGGDLMGSTFVNVSLILGITLLLAKHIEISTPLRKKLYKTIVLIIVLFIGILFIDGNRFVIGIVFSLIYIGSVFWFQAGIPKEAVSREIQEIEETVKEVEKKAILPPKIDILLKLGGSLFLLILSSWLTIHSATKIADLLQINLSIMGATFIAIGTSLPELALEIHAIKQGEYSLALGDIFGSSLLNISLVLGILVLINPSIDLSIGKLILPFLLTCILWVSIRLFQKKMLIRRDGFVFLGVFFLYLLTITIYQLKF